MYEVPSTENAGEFFFLTDNHAIQKNEVVTPTTNTIIAKGDAAIPAVVPITGAAANPALYKFPSGANFGLQDGKGIRINVVSIFPNGQILASGRGDGVVQLWDMATGRLIRSLKGNGKDVSSIAFANDGHTLVAANSEGLIDIWNADGGNLVRSIKDKYGLSCIKMLPDRKTIAAESWGQIVDLWDIDTGGLVRTLDPYAGGTPPYDTPHSNETMDISPDGSTILTAELWEYHKAMEFE